MDYKIEPTILENLASETGIIYIDRSSDETQRIALETIARYFKNEFRYDKMQYLSDQPEADCIGFIFVDYAMDLVKSMDHHPWRVIGGGCFWKNITEHKVSDPIFEWTTEERESYLFDWVWLHPFARNRKKLKRHWQDFKDKFGNFKLSPPLSPHMQQFVKKHN